ncbi:uncharacterized protein LOC123317338 isoform X1 [Coccinella septempunctata]|uniref:uncharacterized protein LOC123317338 isoform X1 n=1 Tax=Coccinella septempunctata TaxID=41139 RepID=UPI001D06100D|nr:uncharacterized protein LOC123317338 isoform X1 [Coccinella septempunctata]
MKKERTINRANCGVRFENFENWFARLKKKLLSLLQLRKMSGDGDQQEHFDGLFLSIAQHHPKGAAQLLDTFVSFLSRKTDFFTGAEEGQWEKLVMSTFRKYEKISRETHEAEQREKREKEAARKAAKAKKEVESTIKPAEITELTDAEAEKLQMEIDAEKEGSQTSSDNKNAVKSKVIGDEEEDASERVPLKLRNSNHAKNKVKYSTKKENKGCSKKELFLKALYLSEEEIEDLQNNTIGQADSPLWKEERRKRLTASNFGKICKMRTSTHCKNAVRALLYDTFTGNQYTKWGKDHEDTAIEQFEELTSYHVEKCGFYVDFEKPYLGASPDGLIGNDAIVEVKCPKTCSEMTPLQGISCGIIKFANLDKGHMKLMRKHHYYYQIQGQLHVAQRKKCYFIVWTPKGLEYELIERDDDFWVKNCEKQLEIFYMNCLLPELADPQYPQGKEIRDLRSG